MKTRSHLFKDNLALLIKEKFDLNSCDICCRTNKKDQTIKCIFPPNIDIDGVQSQEFPKKLLLIPIFRTNQNGKCHKGNSNILTTVAYEGYKLVVKSSDTHERAWRISNTKTVTVTVTVNIEQYKPPLRTAFSWKTPEPCGPDTGNVQDTDFLLWATASDALYHGPFTIGSPIASKSALFLLAFSKALLQNL